MATCKKIKRVSERVCVGSMNKLVKIKTRELEFNSTNDVDFVIDFSNFLDAWAMVTTLVGVQIFDSSNVIRSITHDFYIRYFSDVTFEKWLVLPEQSGNFIAQLFDIVRVENLNEENRFYRLRCNLRGNADNSSNWN